MPTYEVTVDSEGRLVLPREIVTRVGARPGDRIGVAEIGSSRAGFSDALSIRPVIRPSSGLPPKHEVRPSGLEALKEIARRAREDGAVRSAADDPVGDFILDEDRRSRGL